MDGKTEDVLPIYLNRNISNEPIVTSLQLKEKIEGKILKHNSTFRLLEIALLDKDRLPRSTFHSDEDIIVSVTYECLTTVIDLRLMVNILDEENNIIFCSINVDDKNTMEFYDQAPGIYKSNLTIPKNMFGEKRFYITVHLSYGTIEHHFVENILSFEVKFSGYNNIRWGDGRNSTLRPQFQWDTKLIKNPQVTFDV